MQANNSLVVYIVNTYYNIQPILGSIKQLPGYDDRNFLLTDSVDNKMYVLKIVNKDDSNKELTDIIDEVLDNAHEYCEAQQAASPRAHFVVAKLVRTTGTKLSTLTTVKYKSAEKNSTGDDEEVLVDVKCNIKLSEFFDGITICDYINNDPASWRHAIHLKQLERFYNKLGRYCNQLFVFLKSQQHLLANLNCIRSNNSNPWHLMGSTKYICNHLDHFYPNSSHPRRLLVEKVVDEFGTLTRKKLIDLPEFVIHSDLSTKNLLIDAHNSYRDENLDNLKICIIDFQDIQTGPQVIDLAILMLYCIIEQEHMQFETALTLLPRFVFAGYQTNTNWPLHEHELELVPSLMRLRLCQSLLNGQFAHLQDPENGYVMHTNKRGWQLLELMCNKSDQALVRLWQASG